MSQLPKTPNTDDTFDNLLMESFLNRSRSNAGSNMANLISTVLTPSLPLISPSPFELDEISSALPNNQDESRLGYVAKEELRVEAEIVQTILSGDTDSLRPNSGQPIPICGHNIAVGYRDEKESEYRVWEWHGHVMTHDEENRYLEYIYGTYFQKRW